MIYRQRFRRFRTPGGNSKRPSPCGTLPGNHEPRNFPHWRGATLMFATHTMTVKGEALITPEQKACTLALDGSLQIFWTLVERLHAAADQHQPIHQVEEAIFRELLVMGRSLLKAFLALSGNGDVGPTLTVPG